MNLQLTLAGRYLRGRKLRTALTTLAIVFGVLVVFGMNIIIPSMLAAFQGNVLAATGQADITLTHRAGEAFSQSVATKVKAVPGVGAVSGTLNRTINIPSGYFGRETKVDALSLAGIDPRAAQQIRDYPVKQGRFLRPGDDKEAVITTTLAEQLGLGVGDTLRLPTTEGIAKLRIVGLAPPRALPGNEEVLVTLLTAQKLLGMPEQINAIEARLLSTDEAEREAIVAEIKNRLGADYRVGALGGGSEFLASIKTAEIIFTTLGFLALFMGGFIIFNTFRTVVAERRHDIGMLRALGASRTTIVGIMVAEGLLQGTIGTGLGLVLGYLMGAAILAGFNSVWEQFLHVRLGGPVVQPVLVVVSILLGVGVTLLAGLLPAYSASKVTPLEALRPSVAAVERRRRGRGPTIGAALLLAAAMALLSQNVGLAALGGLGCLVGLVLVAPSLVHPLARLLGAAAAALAPDGTAVVAEGNLTRQPSRVAITASTTMVGIAIIVATGGLVASMTGSIFDLSRRTLGSDYILMPPSISVWSTNIGADETLAERLRAVRGVGVVSGLRFAASSIDAVAGRGPTRGDTAVSLLGIDPVTFPQVSHIDFSQGDAKSAFAALGSERAVIINGILASQIGANVGHVITLSTPRGPQEYRVVGVGGDLLNAKVLTAYISQANLEADFRKKEDVFIQLNLAPGANRDEVEAKMKEILADYPQFNLVSGQAYAEEMIQQMNAVFSLMYVFLAAFALPSLIAILNTLAIGVIERTREIGVLRAVGATRPQISGTVVAEAVLLSAIGTVFGLVGGLYLSYMMVLGMNAAGIFPLTYSFPFAGIVAAVAIGLTFGVLAALLPARQASQIEIVRALRYE